jgi:hypothetical protein
MQMLVSALLHAVTEMISWDVDRGSESSFHGEIAPHLICLRAWYVHQFAVADLFNNTNERKALEGNTSCNEPATVLLHSVPNHDGTHRLNQNTGM